MSEVRLAFSTLACPEWTVERAAQAAEDYGFDGIEWRLADGILLGGQTPDDVWNRIASVCARHELASVCLDTSCAFASAQQAESAIAEAEMMARRAAMIGARMIRVFGGRLPKDTPVADVLEPAREALAEAVRRAAVHGVEVAVETHDAWTRARDVLDLVAGSGAKVLWDVAHTVRAGEQPAATLDILGGHLAGVVHLKDADGPALKLLGEGRIPLHDTIRALRSAAYDGWLSFEWEKHWHPELATAAVALPHAAGVLRTIAD